MDCFQILHRCYPQSWLLDLCFWRLDHFWIFGELLKFWNIVITYSNCKMYLLLQFSFNLVETIQGSSIGYKHYGLCLFLTIELILNFWRIFGIFEIVIKYLLTVKCISSYSFHSIVLKFYMALLQDISIIACAFLTIELFLNFWRIFEILI